MILAAYTPGYPHAVRQALNDAVRNQPRSSRTGSEFDPDFPDLSVVYWREVDAVVSDVESD